MQGVELDRRILFLLALGLLWSAEPSAAERRILHEVTVPAGRAEVWQAWTTAEGLTSFFAPAAEIELRLGGKYELYFLPTAPAGQRGSDGCRVLSFVEPEMISFDWNAPPSMPEVRNAEQKSFVVVQFREAGDNQTLVRLIHAGWGAGKEWDKAYAYFEKVWPNVLTNLKSRFESGPVRWGTPAPPAAPAARDEGTATSAAGPAAAGRSADEPESRNETVSSAAPSGDHPRNMREYIMVIRPTRPAMLDAPTPAESQLVAEHFSYLKDLHARGKTHLIGRCMDPAPGGFGVIIFSAESEADARALVAGDPAVRGNVFQAELHPFRIVLSRGSASQ
jgi:uncharacterized protein YndB with AHSA1/START domain/uncharacterized protein YciI